MPYRVEFPPDIQKGPEISGGLSLPKNTGKTGKAGKDGRLLRAVEHDEARQPADNVLTRNSVLGVSVGDVLRVFRGGRVIAENKPISCLHCDKKNVPGWRKGGKIVRRTRRGGSHVWACHSCGREVKRIDK